ncbi:hypothetical protein RBB50_009062 [Rhinocladiella similis]
MLLVWILIGKVDDPARLDASDLRRRLCHSVYLGHLEECADQYRSKSIQQQRNKWLLSHVKTIQEGAVPAPPPGSREVDIKTLRFLQHMMERGLTGHDDLSYHDVIDQFQTGAVRYQLYGVVVSSTRSRPS